VSIPLLFWVVARDATIQRMGYIVLAAAAGLLVGMIWAAIQRFRHRGEG
jgi:4-amino-4-deoxy-L-arabinose transferase-like glycosyltransferase